MEEKAYQAGDYHICSWCRQKLEERGRLQIEPYHKSQYLYPDCREEAKQGGEKDDSGNDS